MLRHMPRPKSSAARQVRLFRNGRNQAVRIPRELELPGNEALLYAEGDRLILEPIARRSLFELLDSWNRIDTAWPDVADPVAEPVEFAD